MVPASDPIIPAPGVPYMTRLVVLGVALLFIAGFAFLTYAEVVNRGFTPASLLSVFILLLLFVGIVGALRNPPR
jgi:hypothetical protein